MVVIEVNGRQYSFEKEGDTIETDYLKLKEGELYQGVKAMLYKDDGGKVLIGKPYLDNCAIAATVVGEKRDKKITVVHYKPKKGVRRKKGFRAKKSLLRIDKFEVK